MIENSHVHRSLLSLVLLLFAQAVPASDDPLRLVPLFTLSYPPPQIAGTDVGGILFTERYAFLATDGGLFRAPLPFGSAVPERIAFESTPVTALAGDDDALYALLDVDHPTGPGATTRTLLKSTNAGESWTPLDEQLEECRANVCERLVGSQVEVVGGRIFVNAGGNVLVSGDEGASWSILQGASSTGKPQAQACSDPAFGLVGRRLLIGGECPLDSAYLRVGTLKEGLLEWEEQPVAATTPDIENRNVQFIRRRGDSGTVYAGIEGGLLRSDDDGASYEYLLHFAGGDSKYPYIAHILGSSTNPSLLLVAGFDKAAGGPFLLVSRDGGTTWRDVSQLLPGVGSDQWFVSALSETPAGRIVIAIEDDAAGSLYVAELRDTPVERRRAVRH